MGTQRDDKGGLFQRRWSGSMANAEHVPWVRPGLWGPTELPSLRRPLSKTPFSKKKSLFQV